MELQAAREILAEVFGVLLMEVDMMIRSRFEAEDRGSKEDGLCPRVFCRSSLADLPESILLLVARSRQRYMKS